MMTRHLVALSLAMLPFAGPLAAQDALPSEASSQAAPVTTVLGPFDPSKDFVLKYDVRLGAQSRPAYFGSDEMIVSPDFAVHFDYVKLKGFGEYGSTDDSRPPSAFGIKGSLRFIGERSSDDYDELKGLEDIDASLELGLGLVYRTRNFEAYGDVRYGAFGHKSFVGELGMDAIAYPTDRWEFRVGPRMVFGDNQFTDTYFGVSSSESRDSGLDAFDAGGGLLGAGIEAKARYRFNDLWGVEASVRADRLLNDAAESPITEMGNEDQFRVKLGITRELILQF